MTKREIDQSRKLDDNSFLAFLPCDLSLSEVLSSGCWSCQGRDSLDCHSHPLVFFPLTLYRVVFEFLSCSGDGHSRHFSSAHRVVITFVPSSLFFRNPSQPVNAFLSSYILPLHVSSTSRDIYVAAGVTSVKQDRLTVCNTLVKDEVPVRGDGQLPRY